MKTEKTLSLTLAIVLLGALSGAAVAAGGGGVLTDPGAMQGKHFHPQGKMPSKFTIELRNGLKATLPFEDERDFEEAKKGSMVASERAGSVPFASLVNSYYYCETT